jgi:hypothetical protein
VFLTVCYLQQLNREFKGGLHPARIANILLAWICSLTVTKYKLDFKSI